MSWLARAPARRRSIPFNIKKQYPFEVKRLVMLAGGTGIAPMIQALHVVLATQGDNTQITLLYGSRTLDVILGYELLNLWAAQCSDQLEIIHVLSREQSKSWTGERGRIRLELIEKYCLSSPCFATTLLASAVRCSRPLLGSHDRYAWRTLAAPAVEPLRGSVRAPASVSPPRPLRACPI